MNNCIELLVLTHSEQKIRKSVVSGANSSHNCDDRPGPVWVNKKIGVSTSKVANGSQILCSEIWTKKLFVTWHQNI